MKIRAFFADFRTGETRGARYEVSTSESEVNGNTEREGNPRADLPSFLSELRRAKENGFTEQSIVFSLAKQIVNSERAGTPCEAKIFVLSSTHSLP